MSRICNKCKSKCLLIPLSCVFDGVTLLSSSLDSDKVKGAMDIAQLTYIKPVLKDCFDVLCTALYNSDLPDSDPEYEALDVKWPDLVDNLSELLKVATEYVYIGRMGLGTIKKSGFLQQEDLDLDTFNRLMEIRKAEILALTDSLESYMEENEDIYGCYEPDKRPCDSDEDRPTDSLDSPFFDIMAI